MSMDTSPQDLLDELSYYEGADVEYKSARGGLPSSLWETYSAFANTGGGTIWLGVVQQEDGQLKIQGIENAQKLKADLWNLLHNREKISRNLLLDRDVCMVPIPRRGSALIRIQVPVANRRERPIYVGKDPFSGSFRRDYEGDFRCTESEVRRMFADQLDDSADSRVLEHFSLDDLHPESLAQFRNRFKSFDPRNPWLAEDDRGLLLKLGAWGRDRETGREGLTLAGLLMFGRELAIRDPAAVPGFHVDYRERFSDDPAVRWTDRVTPDGYWEGNLFQFYQQVIVKLGVGPGLKRPFQIDAEGYRRTTTSVHEALQEALVNALIHTDYTGQGGIVIDRYPDHIEFSNPGTLLLSREQLLRGGVSECRNKSLQLMFQKLGAGDKAGSGLDRIRSSWSAAHWQAPRLMQAWRPDRVRLILSMVSVLPEDAMQALTAQFGLALGERTPDEIQVLVTAQVEGGVTNQRLQEMLAQHPVDITRMLRGLVRGGLLVSEGHGRGTKYALPNSPESLSHSEESLSHSEESLSHSEESLSHSEESLSHSEESLPDLERGKLPGSGSGRDPVVIDLVSPVRSSGATSGVAVESAILAICRGRFLTLRDLADLLNRSQKTLRQSYVLRMVREGALEQRYPETPNHPHQAYRTRRADTP